MTYIFIIIGMFIASLASFCLKKSSVGVNPMDILRNKAFYPGVFLYLASSIITIWLLQRMPYSVVVPMGGISYVWVLLISYKFLGEKINAYKIAGIIFIVFGIVFLSQ
jgi:drug/metabolite transporter (DMT)-like permease